MAAGDQRAFGPHNPIREYEVSVDLPSADANTTAEVDVTVPDVATTDAVLNVVKPTLEAGLAIVAARIKAANTVAITIANWTGTPIDEAAEVLKFYIIKG